MQTYEQLVGEALAVPLRGWDFSWLEGRAVSGSPSWSYPDLARQAIAKATSVVDIDTGGGELLTELAPLPRTVATEGWQPDVARERLAPLGVEVRHQETGIPAEAAEFDLILNRHGRFDAAEAARVLRPGGVVLTQQVGGGNNVELNEALRAPVKRGATCADTVDALERNGFTIVTAQEEWPEFVLHDIGAVVFQLRAVAWQIPDFSVERYDTALRALDAKMTVDGRFVAHDHRYLIEARLTKGREWKVGGKMQHLPQVQSL
jgi:SAM-dependent methyltransferase